MAKIIRRSRVIRPGTRLSQSKNYRVNVPAMNADDVLQLTISHSRRKFNKRFDFHADQLSGDSIHFTAHEKKETIELIWSGLAPTKTKKGLKLFLCRIAWMKFYEGQTSLDFPVSGARYIKEHDTGGEVANFKVSRGKAYGYVPDVNELSIERLGADRHAEQAHNVDVVFCAKHPTEGIIRIVGWYRDATVYRQAKDRSGYSPYHIVANAASMHLVPFTDREFRIPGIFGRGALFYFSRHPERSTLQKRIEQYLSSNGKNIDHDNGLTGGATGPGGGFQPDIKKRFAVEQKAVTMAMAHYRNIYGHKAVQSVEREKKGWDLEVTTPNGTIQVEVKGNSGPELFVLLTPREYKHFHRNERYQLYVLNNALDRRSVERVFEYQPAKKLWIAGDKSVLDVRVRPGAILVLR